MKTKLLFLFSILPFSLMAQTQCEIELMKAMNGGLPLTLQPGIEQVISWDLTTCWFGIQNFQIYVQKPRACPTCTQHNLPPGTPLTLLATNLTTGASTSCPSFNCWMGTVSANKIELHLLLAATAKKPLKVEVSTTAGLGGPP